MYTINDLGNLKIEKGYTFALGKKLIITNVTRSSLNNTRKILYELIRLNILKTDKEYIDNNLKRLHEELKNLGNLNDYINVTFKKITNEDDMKDTRCYTDINTRSFGGGYDMNEIKIILI